VLRLDYHVWRSLAIPMALAAVVSMALVLVPGLGVKVGGSHRWLHAGPVSVQPSEFGKLAVVVALAAWMDAAGHRADTLWRGLLLPGAGLGLVMALLMAEPDYGTAILTGVVGIGILFGGGARLSHLALATGAGLCLIVLAVLWDPLRLARIMVMVAPEDYPATAYHVIQSKAAFIRGHWIGVGLGESLQKELYLPEAHTDFILAIIGEETGLVGTASVVLLFAAFAVCGAVITLKAPDPFGKLLALGLTLWIGLQAAINIGVVTACLPPKGLPLPFISYGGSSLLASITAACILASIGLHATEEDPDDDTRLIKDRAHRF
jgi:cell division protein FtsW